MARSDFTDEENAVIDGMIQAGHADRTARTAELSVIQRAERDVIGCVLICERDCPEIIGQCLAIVDQSDFENAINARVWAAIQDMAGAGIPLDIHTVAARAGLRPDGVQDLLGMAADVPVALNGPWYAKIVAAAAAKRRIIATAGEATRAAGLLDGEPEEIIESVSKTLEAIAARRRSTSVRTGKDVADLALDRLDESSVTSIRGAAIGTQFPTLDLFLGGGLVAEQLLILAARTSVGKSAFAGQVAMHVAMTGVPVLYVTLEMAESELANRWLAQIGRIDHGNLIRREKLPWSEIHAAAGRIAKAEITVVDDQSSVRGIVAAAMRWRRKAFAGPGLLVVDYLQLMQSPRMRGESRQEAVAEITRTLKDLAKTIDVSVLALAQLGAAVETEDRTPRLADLRESGAIEQDADVVLFLSRGRGSADVLDAELIVAKNRGGRVGKIKLTWEGRYLTFAESPEA